MELAGFQVYVKIEKIVLQVELDVSLPRVKVSLIKLNYSLVSLFLAHLCYTPGVRVRVHVRVDFKVQIFSFKVHFSATVRARLVMFSDFIVYAHGRRLCSNWF